MPSRTDDPVVNTAEPGRSVAVILAAGGGSRFAAGASARPEGGPALRFGTDGATSGGDLPGAKLRAHWRGRPLLTWAVEHALAAGLDETWVVAGAADLAGLLPPEVRVLPNPDWVQGQATSLAVAVDAARERGAEAVVIGLGDQPDVPASAWRAVAAATFPISVATYGGRRRNPVRLARGVWELLPRSGDAGARVVMTQRPELVGEVPCQGNPGDIDTVEDLQGWN
jgi:molybdenum cofactor cytidylyltransferase